MKSLIFYVSVFYDLCKCLLFRFMGGFLLLTRLNERFNQHIICRLISLIVFRLQGVVRFLPFAMLFLKQFLRRGAQLLFGGEDRAETSPSAAFVPTDIFPVAPSETLYVRCRLRVPTPSSDGLAAAAKNSVSARIRRPLPHHDGAHPHLKFDRRIPRRTTEGVYW